MVTTGRLERKRGRGRLREAVLNNLAPWHGEIFVSEVIVSTRDRRLCTDLITNDTCHGGIFVSEVIVTTRDRGLCTDLITITTWHGL